MIMDHRGRRSRRNRGPSQWEFPQHLQQSHAKSSLLNSVISFVIMASLVAAVYIMLEYHCKVCSCRTEFTLISQNLDDISRNLTAMTKSYQDLESKVSKFSQDLPKIEGQIEILEALANNVDFGDCMWNPKNRLSLPNVDIAPKNLPKKANVMNESKKAKPSHLILTKAY